METGVIHSNNRKLLCFQLVLLLTMVFAVAIPLVAMAVETHEEGSHEGGEHEFHRHHMALLLGNTQSEESSNGPSIGVDYEYRFNKWLGIGGLVEWAGGDFDHLLVIVPLYIHPYKGWLFNVSLGSEIAKEHEENGEHGEHEEGKDKRYWLFRAGVAYQFPVGDRYTIGPEFNVDFSEHETTIAYGIAFGVGF